VEQCSLDQDLICGAWVTKTDCVTEGKTCGTKSGGGPQCRCTSFTVVPQGTAPAACEHAAINTAIGAAGDWGVKKVVLGGAPGGVYGRAPADQTGITVPPGMTLAGDDPAPAPAGRLLEVTGGAEGVRVEAGASLVGLTVQRAAAGPLVALRIAGASDAAAPSLRRVNVAMAPGPAFGIGILVEGSGAVTLDTVKVDGATAAGLEVARDGADDAVTVSGAVLDGNGVGVLLGKGELTLESPSIWRSTGEGISASLTATGSAKLTVTGGTIAHGKSLGISVKYLDRLHLSATRVCGNDGTNLTLAGVPRKVGGLLAQGAAPVDLALSANLFHDNGGDQVVVASATGWRLSGAACDGTQNVLAGYAGSTSGVGLAAIAAGAVDARNCSWKTDVAPSSSTDYYQTGTGTTVDATTSCQAGTAPVCPSAPP
jgi:hypothetical protein